MYMLFAMCYNDNNVYYISIMCMSYRILLL